MNHREIYIFSVVSFGVILVGSEGTHCPYRNSNPLAPELFFLISAHSVYKM